MTTADRTGKVKRLRNDPRVRLAPSTMRGKVADDATWVDAVATIEPMTPALSSVLGAKYGLMACVARVMGGAGVIEISEDRRISASGTPLSRVHFTAADFAARRP